MIRFIAAILLLPWVVGFAVQLPALAKSIYAEPTPLAPFGVGVGLYALVWALFIRKRGRGVWDTFEHELTHAVFCVLLFKKVRSFHADSDPDHRGFLGYVAHEEASGFRGVLITLAPYFFPTFTAFLLLIRLLVADEFLRYFDIVLGASFSYHLISNWQEFGFHQDDIRRQKLFFSTVFILLANLIVIPVVLIVLLKDWASVPPYLVQGVQWPYLILK